MTPFAYMAKRPGHEGKPWAKLVCPECVGDPQFTEWYAANPEPISESDALGNAEGYPLTCDCCSTEASEWVAV